MPRRSARRSARARLTLGVRPEHLRDRHADDANTISGKLFANENMGPEKLVTFERQDGGRVTARIFTDEMIALGDDVTFSFDDPARHAVRRRGRPHPRR